MITIEPLRPDDFSVVGEWLSRPAVNEWLTSDWRGRTVDPTLLAMTSRNKKNRLYLVRDENEPAGLVALADLDAADGIAMVWYLLGNSDTGGKGIISTALGQLLSVAFTTLDLHAINAWIIADNTRSRRVLERNGFREVGRLREAVVRDGVRQDRIYFDITRAEHQASAQAVR